MKIKLLGILLFIFISTGCIPAAFAQDSLYTKYGDLLLGKIDKITSEKIYFKTAYRSAAVDIKLGEIAKVSSPAGFLLNDIRNKNWRGQLILDSTNRGMVGIKTLDSVYFFKQKEIFELAKDQKKRFRDRFKLGIDLGFTRAKSENSLSLSAGMYSRYRTRRWDTNFDFQNYAAIIGPTVIGRSSFTYNLSYILPKEWFFNGRYLLFSTTEQNLDLRRNFSLSLGRFLVHREEKVFAMSGGLVSNREKYFDNPQVFQSVEGNLNTHLSGRFGENFEAITEWGFFPSLTEKGRIRNTLSLDWKYLFLNHFNIGIHYVLNTDSDPPLETENRDFILEVKFGWTIHRR